MSDPQTSNEFIEQALDERARVLEETLDADLLTLNGSILYGVDDLIRSAVEYRKAQDKSRDKLVVFITTRGGYIEVAQRIVETFRHHYTEAVDFFVPNQAFSAGTVIALSGDAIYMDYYSRLGPIDPQVETGSGRRVPALGYLRQYERLLEKANQNKISVAELRLLIDGFDQAELYQFEQARNLTITLLKRWLVSYKFRNWDRTETRGLPVTPAMKTRRAGEIAKALNKTDRWHSHGYGISMTELDKDLKIKIDDFSQDSMVYKCVKNYATLMDDYMVRRNVNGVVHVIGRWTPYTEMQ